MAKPLGKDVNLGLQMSDTKSQVQNQSRPITTRELEDFLKLQPEEAARKLLRQKSMCCLLVRKQEVQEESLMLLVQVFAHVAAPISCRETMNELILLICGQGFLDRMCSYTMRIKRKYPEKCHDFLKHLFILLEAYAGVIVSANVDRLSNLIDMCLAVLQVTEDAELLEKYEELQKLSMEEQRKGYHGHGRKAIDTISLLDDVEPPEDFRDLPSFPTCEELLKREQPFVRRNITKGAYKDNNHYLDVQFRLLREDFIRPLRTGINDFKEGIRNRDIRVYKDVTISKPVIKEGEIMHIAQVKLPKHINLENSKRLMHENLLCLSNDGFQTLLLGTVADTDNLARKGFLGIRFHSDLRTVDLKGSFVMIESKAYFMAYKYVLQGLKNLADKVPFEPYIIYVKPNVDIPKYLREDTLYDLRVVKDLGLKVKPGIYRKPIDAPLCNVNVKSEIDTWPTSEELGLDDSQRRALHSALTQCFAIIQGPPGTGKTFIGLKITQVLLHNSTIWKNKVDSSPILVISFTNHALDQFLEEISKCTNRIVRVGNRTKSTTIAEFQISHVTRSLGFIPSKHRKKEIRSKMEHVEKEMKKLQAIAEGLKHPPGIISLNALVKVIPNPFLFQLHFYPLSLWLLDQRLLGEAKMDMKRQTKSLKPAFEVPSDLHFEVTLEFLEKQRKESERNQNVLAQMHFQFLTLQMEILQIGLQIPEDPDKIVELEQTCVNIWTMGITTRWQLYKHWVKKFRCQILDHLSTALDSHRILNEDLQKCKNEQSLYAMKQASVVGMTTTGAARNAQVLKDLAPSIVIIEEAAEVLESHVVTSLTTECKHVILIGDHQQLRPSPTVHELATKYELGISLFERMIRNGLPFSTLEYQHRMRPNISTLLVPSIYPALKDSPSVNGSPRIRGLQKDVFFFSHEFPEQRKADDDMSHENLREAQFLVGLCRHLMLQGYAPDEVTIIAAYSGQFFLLRKLQQERPECKGVKICVLDSFQGEENKIILLSLVRNNDQGVIGFLRTKNRVCVALSRAKHGFYIAGNMDMLTACSDLWRNVKQVLVKEESLGDALFLKCENHPKNLQSVKCYEDFLAKSPHGGCLLKCGQKLPDCDHLCEWQCHMKDMQHANYKCSKPCSKVRCDLNHQCPKLCWKKCGSCETIVTKTFPCGHTNTLPCKEEACPTLVERVMADCQHIVAVPCHSQKEVIPCPVECDTRLACGHVCRLKCHATEDPDHQNYTCMKKCTKLRRECTQAHRCPQTCGEECDLCLIPVTKVLLCGHEANEVECHVPMDEVWCSVKVNKALMCGHEAEDVDCSSTIKSIKCTVLTTRVLPCGHEVDYATCGAATEEVLCRENCLKILDCGHACKMLCHEECSDCSVKVSKTLVCGHEAQGIECRNINKNIKCTVLTKRSLPCGHVVNYECGTEAKEIKCREKCLKTLECGHICKKLCNEKCGDCLMKVEKTIPECGHVMKAACSSKAVKSRCNEKCPKKLPCGHPCKAKCKDPCTSKCHERVNIKCLGNHVVSISCFEQHQDTEMIDWYNCNKKCEQILSCGHKCNGNCSGCLQGRVHKPCKEQCNKRLICGHLCTSVCGEVLCPPCTQKCAKRCIHRVCNKLCVAQCDPCQKPCEWSCQHHRCRSRCSAPCGKGPCDQPCQKKLACGHACAGLCGDPCPPLCPVCHRKELREAFLGRPWDGGRARFVLLEDCGHTVDSKTMEKHIGKYKGEIGFVACPRCGHPIFHLRRFKHSIQEANERVKQVFYIYFISTPSIELKGWNLFKAEIVMTTPKCKKASSKLQRWAKQAENYSLVEFIDFLLHGAARFLKTWRMVKTRSPSPSVPALEAKAMTFLFAMLQRVLSPSSGAITHQLVEEVQWELRRLENYLCYTVMEDKGTGSGANEAGRGTGTRRVKAGTTTTTRIKGAGADTGKNKPRLDTEIRTKEGGGDLGTKEAGTGVKETGADTGTKEAGARAKGVREVKGTSALSELSRLIDPRVKFSEETQLRVREFMKNEGKAEVHEAFSTWERFQPRMKQGLSRGSWFLCPRGDIYHWAEGAGDGGEGKCPFCDPRGAGSRR